MLAAADPERFSVQPRAGHALAGVSVALAPGAHGEVSNPVEVGAQHLRISEHLVAEGVEAVQGDADVRCRDPLLQLRTGVEGVGGRTSLQRGESDVAAGQGRDVRVLGRAQSAGLVALASVTAVRETVGVSARGAVKLVGCPWPVLFRPLVYSKTFRPW